MYSIIYIFKKLEYFCYIVWHKCMILWNSDMVVWCEILMLTKILPIYRCRCIYFKMWEASWLQNSVDSVHFQVLWDHIQVHILFISLSITDCNIVSKSLWYPCSRQWDSTLHVKHKHGFPQTLFWAGMIWQICNLFCTLYKIIN